MTRRATMHAADHRARPASLPCPRVTRASRCHGHHADLVMGALSVLLLGVIMAQIKPAMFAAKNAKTIFAAETGIDAGLSQIRSALGARTRSPA